MLRTCQHCGRIHDSRYDCGKHPKRPERADKEENRLRTCRRWDKTRKRVNERDRHLCRVCLSEEHRFNSAGLETHHIVPLHEAPELAYEDDNLITLCVRHHKAADRGQIERKTLLLLTKQPITVP